MFKLVVLTLFFVISIVLLSRIFKEIGKKAILLLAFTLLSLVLFLMSFFVGGWEGMGLGAVSVSLFLASLVAFIVIVLIHHRKKAPDND